MIAGLVGLLAAVAVAEAPALNLPDTAYTGTLSESDRQQLDEYIKYWTNQLAGDNVEANILSARDKLRDVYTKGEAAFQAEFAKRAVPLLAPALAAQGDLRRLRQVSAGLLLATMAQPSSEPVLQKAVAAADPVVRYYGWMGYRNIRRALLSQSNTAFYDLLATQAAQEPSPVVLGMMMDVLNLNGIDLAGIGANVLKKATEKSLDTILASWPRICRGLRDSDLALSDTARRGLAGLTFYSEYFKTDNARVKSLLQAVMDAMWCAAIAYDSAKDAIKGAEDRLAEELQVRLGTLGYILQESENIANNLSGKGNRYIKDSLPRNLSSDRYLQTLKWVDELAPMGVKKPEYPGPDSNATQPASAPATRPNGR